MANNTAITIIGDFMARSFGRDTVPVDEDIFESGYTNSLFAMQLVDFIERQFGIEIDAEDLQIDNFRTVERVAALVERKTACVA